MFNRYRKTDAPSWQHNLVVLLIALFAATLLLFIAWTIVLFIDRSRAECPEPGAAYSEQSAECEPDDRGIGDRAGSGSG